ncbi:retrovirus-related pol polyprotein from transposon TNT 1-94 [Tanacetum coccineum]|uniref:Retrovirus-related pol polyprotein from transposon TNT 1-94 n=1 Tax=Tanacetum coccineum TaxID=301880 RepID=A0ABQ5FNU9_9ASTR
MGVSDKDVNLSVDEVTLAQALAALKTASTRPGAKGIVIHEQEQAPTPIVFSQQPSHGKDLRQVVQRFTSGDEFDKTRKELKREAEAQNCIEETWMIYRQKIEADCLLAERLKTREQEELTIKERAKLFQQLLEKRRKHFAAKRAEEKRNRPPTKAQQRSIMCTYLKTIEGWKPKDLKNKSFANIQELFDKAMKRVNTFVDYRTELAEGSLKKADAEIAQESSLKRVGVERESRKEMQLKLFLWLTKLQELFSHMLKSFDREDLETLYKLVKAKYGSTRPVEDLDLVLYGDLKTMFDPHVEDQMENLNDTKVKQLKVTMEQNSKITLWKHSVIKSASLPKQFWGEVVNAACYTQNRSIIMKRHRKIAYEVFRGRAPDIIYFHVFGCPVHIHNHRDHLGKFDEKEDDGFFLGYSSVAKSFRVFNIRRQEMEETFHVTFSEDDEAISQTSTEGDAINFNEVNSFPDDEFHEPRNSDTLCNANTKYFPYVPAFDHLSTNNKVSPELVIISLPLVPSILKDSSIPNIEDVVSTLDETLVLRINSPLADVILQPPVLQDRWSREKHIELVNIIGEPLAGITTRSRIRDSDVASASKCLYVNFLLEIKPKKLIEALEEKGWILAMTEELNQFERNKVWTLIPKPYGKTIIGLKWVFRKKMDEEGW